MSKPSIKEIKSFYIMQCSDSVFATVISFDDQLVDDVVDISKLNSEIIRSHPLKNLLNEEELG